jgi:hypothetical protein
VSTFTPAAPSDGDARRGKNRENTARSTGTLIAAEQ